MNRAERRNVKERKWISRLKKVFNSGYRTIVMPIKKSNWRDYDDAQTFDELKRDRFGVLLKNTGTVCSDKRLTIQEERRRNLNNRKITEEEMIEAQETIENINDPYSFEKYCGACDKFGTRECTHPDLAITDAEWKKIGCEDFWD